MATTEPEYSVDELKRINVSKLCKQKTWRTETDGSAVATYAASKGDKTYVVELGGGQATCTCFDFKFRSRNIGFCKHIYHAVVSGPICDINNNNT